MASPVMLDILSHNFKFLIFFESARNAGKMAKSNKAIKMTNCMQMPLLFEYKFPDNSDILHCPNVQCPVRCVDRLVDVRV